MSAPTRPTAAATTAPTRPHPPLTHRAPITDRAGGRRRAVQLVLGTGTTAAGLALLAG